MFVRLALDDEIDIFEDFCVADLEETMPGEPYDRLMIRGRFKAYLDDADPTVFFAEHKGKVVGMLVAYICQFDYRDGLYIKQRVIYVSPENRGTRAAVLLVKEMIRWAESLDAVGIDGGNNNSFQSDRTAAFLEHFGFERVGFSLVKLLGRTQS